MHHPEPARIAHSHSETRVWIRSRMLAVRSLCNFQQEFTRHFGTPAPPVIRRRGPTSPRRYSSSAREIRISRVNASSFPPSRAQVIQTLHSSAIWPPTWFKNEPTSRAETTSRTRRAAAIPPGHPKSKRARRNDTHKSHGSLSRSLAATRSIYPRFLPHNPRKQLWIEIETLVCGARSVESFRDFRLRARRFSLVFAIPDSTSYRETPCTTTTNTTPASIDWPDSASGAVKRARSSGTSDSFATRYHRWHKGACQPARTKMVVTNRDKVGNASRRGRCRAVYCQNIRQAVLRTATGAPRSTSMRDNALVVIVVVVVVVAVVSIDTEILDLLDDLKSSRGMSDLNKNHDRTWIEYRALFHRIFSSAGGISSLFHSSPEHSLGPNATDTN